MIYMVEQAPSLKDIPRGTAPSLGSHFWACFNKQKLL